MPRVSILLTCYNHLRFLAAAVDGVLAQTFRDYEILALDDGSTDGTREWLTELTAREPRVKLHFNETNLGTYGTLNVGLTQASGEFIAILNDDDLWAPEKLALQLAMLDANPRTGIVHTGGWFIDDDGARHPNPAPFGFTFPKTRSGDLLADLIERNQMITSAVLFRREALDGPFNEKLFGSGDWQAWLRIARGWEIGFVDEPLTFYRIHDHNASHQTEKTRHDDIAIREWIVSWQDEYASKLTPALRNAFAHNWACLGTVYAREGRKADSRRAYARSIKMLPGRLKSYARWMQTFAPGRSR